MIKQTRREFISFSIKSLAGLSIPPLLSCAAQQASFKRDPGIPEEGYPLFEVGGSHKEIGKQTAHVAGDIIKRYLQSSPDFNKCVNYLKKNGKQKLIQMAENARASFPGPVAEIEGLAEGLGIPFLEVFALNCKPEIGLLTRAYGCSTLGWCKGGRMVLAHNEDGHISDSDNMFLLKVAPASGVKFLSFMYPCLLPGVGPTINSYGIVQTTNYIHPRRVFDGIPRYFIGCAILESKDLKKAVAIATVNGRAFPCHHNIASLKEARLLSIETFPGRHHVLEVQGGHLHTNHFVHPQMIVSDSNNRCVPYESSTTRYRVLSKAIKAAGHHPTRADEMLKLLSLHEGSPYSPCRHPKGRIRGVTLGTAIFEAPELAMTLFHGNPCFGHWKRYEL